jgi:ribosomal protein S7
MKKLVLAILGLSMFTPALAQDLPQPSPAATVKQRVGLTDITVEYSRPSKKDREIFGGLVPYNELWRTGANRNTMVTFSTDVVIGDNEVAAGTYSLFTIPTQNNWEVILNKNTNLWGTDGYSQEEDVVRISLDNAKVDAVETFTISFENVMPNSADMVISWDDRSVHVPVTVDSQKQALANIDKALKDPENKENLWRVYRNAAGYYYQNKLNLAEAEKFIGKSIELNKESWYSYWLQASIYAEAGKKKEAVKSAETALKMGEQEAKKANKEFGYAKMIQEGIDTWKKK